MTPLSLPDSDWVLQLAPRFGFLGSPGQELALGLLALVPLVLLGWLYLYEIRLARPWTGGLLLILRSLVLGVLWLVVALQPVLTRTTEEELPSRVVVIVDRSLSMDFPDPQRSSLEKLLLAKTLALRPETDQPFDKLLDNWITHHRRTEERPTTWLLPEEETQPPDQQRALVELRRVLYDRLLQQVNGLTRRQIVQTLLAPEERNLLGQLSVKHKLELLAFHKDLWTFSPQDVTSGTFGEPTVVGVAATAQAKLGAYFTDLGQPLARTVERAGPQDGPILGVLLFSDGRHNRGDSPVALASQLGKSKVPIYPIALGSKKPSPDIAVTDLQAPANILPGKAADVTARFHVSGLPAQAILVELRVAGQPPLPEHKKTLPHDGKNRSYTVHFPLRLEQLGTHKVEVQVRPSQPKVAEVTTDNNSRSVAIRVAEDKARVLVVEGEARWEYQYLINVLKRDKTLKPEAVVFVQPRLGHISEKELENSDNPRRQLPPWNKDGNTPDPLHDYACIILGDVSPAQLTAEHRERLARYVSDAGGTLLLVAGKRWMPLAFGALKTADGRPDPLARLLPLESLEVAHPTEGFAVTLTPEGIGKPYLQMETTAEQSLARWAKLPHHYWAVLGRAKPGAECLATVKLDADTVPEAGQPPLNRPAREQALVVLQNYGFGQVLYLGLDSTWRWRYREGDTYHHRFWGQLLSWAASDKLLPAGNQFVRYGAKQPAYVQGEAVQFQVRLAATVPSPAGTKQARILRVEPDKRSSVAAVIDLQPGPTQSRLLQGQSADLPPGTYRLELNIPELNDKIKIPAGPATQDQQHLDTFVVTPADSGELLNLSYHWPLLETLAKTSGGEIVSPDRLEELVERLRSQVRIHEFREEQRLWQDPPLTWALLGVVLVLLTGEWVVRKLVGLP